MRTYEQLCDEALEYNTSLDIRRVPAMGRTFLMSEDEVEMLRIIGDSTDRIYGLNIVTSQDDMCDPDQMIAEAEEFNRTHRRRSYERD